MSQDRVIALQPELHNKTLSQKTTTTTKKKTTTRKKTPSLLQTDVSGFTCDTWNSGSLQPFWNNEEASPRTKPT